MEILVVEDDPATLQTLAGFLGELDHTIHKAGSAEEAMEVLGLHTGQEPSKTVDLIITDYQMPGLSGAELTDIIRTHRQLEFTHVIMVTTHDNLETLTEAYQTGVIDFIGKPVEKASFLAKVREALKAISQEKEAAVK